MKFFWRFLITFLAVTGLVAIATGFFGVDFGNSDFWHHHGFLFLIFITFFPRITLILSSVPTGGVLWWLSWFFVPRLLVAILATVSYWRQNPALVVMAWLIAFGGESSEKYIVVSRTRRSDRGKHKTAKWVDVE